MQSGCVFITLVSVSIVRSKPLKKSKKKAEYVKEWTEKKEKREREEIKNIPKKKIYDPSGSDHEQSYLAVNAVSAVIEIVFFFFLFWINYIDY